MAWRAEGLETYRQGILPRHTSRSIAPGRCYNPRAITPRLIPESSNASISCSHCNVLRPRVGDARLRSAVAAHAGARLRRARQRDVWRHRLRAHPLVHALPPADGRRRGVRGGRQICRAEGSRVRARRRALHSAEVLHGQLDAEARRALVDRPVRAPPRLFSRSCRLACRLQPANRHRGGRAGRRWSGHDRGGLRGQGRWRQGCPDARLALGRDEGGSLESGSARADFFHDQPARPAGPGAVAAHSCRERRQDQTRHLRLRAVAARRAQAEGGARRGREDTLSCPRQGGFRISRTCVTGHRRSRDPRDVDSRSGDRAHRPPAGRALLGE